MSVLSDVLILQHQIHPVKYSMIRLHLIYNILYISGMQHSAGSERQSEVEFNSLDLYHPVQVVSVVKEDY